jgi:hypothetical protein
VHFKQDVVDTELSLSPDWKQLFEYLHQQTDMYDLPPPKRARRHSIRTCLGSTNCRQHHQPDPACVSCVVFVCCRTLEERVSTLWSHGAYFHPQVPTPTSHPPTSHSPSAPLPLTYIHPQAS